MGWSPRCSFGSNPNPQAEVDLPIEMEADVGGSSKIAEAPALKAKWPKHSWEALNNASKHIGVSKNRGTPKWMVYNGKPY